ncbi:lumenal Hsp70 protein [Lecanora helva]
MPTHSQRRPSNLTTVFLCLFIFLSTASAASAVLGIDLGTEYIKAALVKPGIPLDIVLTKDSKRKEIAAVAFKPLRARVNTAESDLYPERVYGGDAVALSARYPTDVYPNLKPLLGLKLSDDVASDYRDTHSELQMVESDRTGTIGFKSDCFVTEEQPWLVEELLAMELKNVKKNAENMAGKGSIISDSVITIPSFYTVEERRAITTAAELAGLRVLSLISDGLSVGLNYATSRTFPVVNEGGKPEIHLVYDMGAGSTSATLLRFQGRTVKDVGKYNKTIQEVQVLGTAWDKSLGGDALNRVLLEDMIEKIVSTTHMKNLSLMPKHIKSHGRTMAKLWKEAERIRQVLSANTETSATFEGLYYEDFTFKYKLSRADFESLASKYLDRVRTPIEEALASAKLSLADVESVILHGGAVRTPFVQKQLESIVTGSDKIRTNVNGDEAAVFGAAFKAAGISPSFRVKEIRAADNAVYPVSMHWTLDGKDKHQKLFVPTSQVGAEKQISVKAHEDFSFSLVQQPSSETAGLPITNFKTENLTESVKQLNDKFGCDVDNISTRVAIHLSPTDGLPEVISGTISCEVLESETKKGGVVKGVKDLFGFGSKKEGQEPLKESNETESSTSASTSTTESETSISSSATQSASSESSVEEPKNEEKPKELKKRTETLLIGISNVVNSFSKLKPEILESMNKRLNTFDKSDRSRVLREEALNTLEGYTYKIRDILEDEDFVLASTQAQRDDIETKSNDASMWLYGDGAEATRETLKAKLDELRSLVEPIQKRKGEAKKRPDEVQKLKDALAQAETMVQVVKNQREAQVSIESEAASKESESSKSKATETPTSSVDEFAELDDDPATASSTTKQPTPSMPAPLFSEEDLQAMIEKQGTIQKWLDEKLVEQEKLTILDEPAVWSSDLSAKSQELNDAVMGLLTKQMKTPPKPKPKKAKTTKSTKSSSVSPSAADSNTVESGEPPKASNGPADILEGEMEGMHEVTQEEIDEAMSEQKSKAEKTKKTSKPKASGKSKSKKKSNAKVKGKDKGKADIKEELAQTPLAIDHDVHFRPGVGAGGEETFTPRTLIYDLKGGFGGLRKWGGLYEQQQLDDGESSREDPGVWNGDVVLRTDPQITQSDYQRTLDEGEPDPQKLSTQTVRYWSDFNRVFYHPRSIVQINDYALGSSLMPFERWESGEELFLGIDRESDLIDRDVRLWAEECDQMQGFQICTGGDDAWGGFASKYVQSLRDEFGKMPIWVWGVEEEQGKGQKAKQLLRALNVARTINDLSPQSSMYIPLAVPAPPIPHYVQMDRNSQWHTSALLAMALESVTLPSRLRAGLHQRGRLGDLEGALNVNGNQRIAQLQCSIMDTETQLSQSPGLDEKRDHRVPLSSVPLTAEDEQREDDSIGFDMELSGNGQRTSLSSSQPHVFGAIEQIRGSRDAEVNLRSGDDRSNDTKKQRRFAGLPVVERYQCSLGFPLLDSFPGIFHLGRDANTAAVRTSLSTTSALCTRLRHLQQQAGKLANLDERELLSNGLGAIREAHIEGWQSDSEYDSDN